MAILVKILGCGSDTTSYSVLCVLLKMSTLFFRFSLPGKWPVCCIGSNITSLCGVVRFATCLAGRMNSFWLRFSSVTVFEVVVVIIIGVVVWDIVIGVTVFVSRIILIFFQFLLSVFSTGDTDFYNALVFRSGGTLVWICQH